MAKKKKLTPAQREKKQQFVAERELQKKQAIRKTVITAGCIALVVILAVILIIAVLSSRTTTTSGTSTATAAQAADPLTLRDGDGATLEDAVVTHYATIEIADYGTITLELYGKSAPVTVENFVALAESGFYNGLTFHRIVEGFMMQGGAPDEDSPTVTSIVGEFASNGFENNLLHERGVISMARASAYNSASSQFFIMHATKSHLDGYYAAFGYVIDGIEVVDKICEAAEPTDGNGSIAEKAQPVITSITITYPQ